MGLNRSGLALGRLELLGGTNGVSFNFSNSNRIDSYGHYLSFEGLRNHLLKPGDPRHSDPAPSSGARILHFVCLHMMVAS